jgi:DNA-directed RNA polymerase specialized sigma24 family protein
MKSKNPANTPLEFRSRNYLFGIPSGIHVLDTLDTTRSPWAETAKEVEAGLRRGTRKERQLAWVRSQMLLRLTKSDQEAITLYYFHGLNYRQAGILLHMNGSSVYRAARRRIRKLKEAARESGKNLTRRRKVEPSKKGTQA